MKIAIIGAGISGIAAAHSLNKSGHESILFEKSADIGGVWALGYPGVRLQNTGLHYRISDIPWPFTPDQHPTSAQVHDYLERAVDRLELDVRRECEVTGMLKNDRGWTLEYRNREGAGREEFDFVVVAVGQYSEGKYKPEFPGQSGFRGEIITERDVTSLDVFDGKRVVVVGFGKSAVDMATFAVERARQVHHVFRTPRWLIPFHILGVHYARWMFCRMTTTLMPAWAQPNRFENLLHTRGAWLIRGVWHLTAKIIRMHCYVYGLGKSERARQGLNAVLPDHYFVGDLRSAAAMAPEFYYPYVAEEKILPVHAELDGFSESGVRLGNGTTIDCDQVVLSLGSQTPRFPFFPPEYRQLLEAEEDGVQLYRHLLHPDIPGVAFAGFNHGFMHVPAVEVSMLWLSALLDGDLQLPSKEKMHESIEHIRAWKRAHINYEPSRSCAVNTRFQQYIDILLQELGISPYRKMPNVFAELFSQYGAADYESLLDDYRRAREKTSLPRQVSPLHT